MGLGSSKNRRRSDVHDRVERVRGVIAHRGATVARLLGGLIVGLLLLAGAAWGWVWAQTTPRFAVRQISFTGLHRASEAELLRLAGVSAGQNVFALDTTAAERAMAQHPWVREVTLSRRLPGGLSVQVVEHAPYALMALGELYLVDREGRAFRRVEPGDGLDLPLLTGVDRDAYVDRPDTERARIAAALAVAEKYQASPGAKRARLSELRLEPHGGLTLFTGDGAEVRLGQGEVDQKLARLWRVHKELEARGVRPGVIHLDNRTRPLWVAIQVSAPVSERSGGR